MKESLDYLLVSFLDSFDFPLREATRKQIWWEALEHQKEGRKVTIIIVDHHAERSANEGIDIMFLSLKEFCKQRFSARQVHYLTGSIVPNLLSIITIKSQQKRLTLVDGYMYGTDKYLMRKLISKFIPFLFDEVNVFSQHQQRLLGYGSIIQPHLPKLTVPDLPKSKNPTVFYMGHISKNKGFDAIIPAIQKFLKIDSNHEFVLANNMIEVSSEYMGKINVLLQEFPTQITIKGVINPAEELKKAWVYIYPFIEPRGTMAFPLSLYESLQCGTPFVACDISANAEFFDKKYLIEPGNAEQLYEKIIYFVNERKNKENIQ